MPSLLATGRAPMTLAGCFALTLKERLQCKSWQFPEKVERLLKQLRRRYNDRPRKGLPVPDLWPRKKANQLQVI